MEGEKPWGSRQPPETLRTQTWGLVGAGAEVGRGHLHCGVPKLKATRLVPEFSRATRKVGPPFSPCTSASSLPGRQRAKGP